jgi:hypothetical protein
VHEPCDREKTIQRDGDAGMVEIDDERLNQAYDEL